MYGVSVIICTYNGENRLTPTLEALINQKIPEDLKWEILIIDNASTDKTAELSENILNPHREKIDYRIIKESKAGKANALITGFNASKFELMLVCDDDNWLQAEYLKTVSEIFEKHPETGLAGGYGIAEFRGEDKPDWFEKWKSCYASTKHHNKTGFLKPGDASIWGAGSVIRKKVWEYLLENGFEFTKSTDKGKPMGEDTELSHAIMYTGSKLYFDERLWFKHDLSGNRLSKKKRRAQLKSNDSAIFVVFHMAYHGNNNKNFYPRFIRILFSLSVNLFFQFFTKDNYVTFVQLRIQYFEFALHPLKYKRLFEKSDKWISKIKDTYPLKNEERN